MISGDGAMSKSRVVWRVKLRIQIGVEIGGWATYGAFRSRDVAHQHYNFLTCFHAHDDVKIVKVTKKQKPKHTAARSDLEKAVAKAGFRLGPSLHDEPSLWCAECGRDSGYHYDHCSKWGR